jgi:general stress protein YciG
MTQSKRGFASWSKEKQREIARRGGQASGASTENLTNQ